MVAGENIASRLAYYAAIQPTTPAVIHGSKVCRFDELLRRCDAYAHRLTGLGVARGTRVALMVRPGVEFFALTFALLKMGAIPVMIDPGMGLHHVGLCLEEAAPDVFIGIPLAHVARVWGAWRKGAWRTLVSIQGYFPGARLLRGTSRPGEPFVGPKISSEDVAAILFTSGSTGVPKGAVYLHRTFCAQVDILAKEFGVGPGQIDLPTFPLFALFDAALGVTAIIPRMDFTRPGRVDPRAILEPIQRYGVTQMFASPALLDRVSRWGVSRGVKLAGMKRVFSAGAPVSPGVLKRFCHLLPPEATVYTPYGATEALPVAHITAQEILTETAAAWAKGEGTCVGRPVGGVEVAVIPVNDEPIAEWMDALRLPVGVVGELVVRGPVVSPRYCQRPDHDARGKITAPDGTVWHRMGDLGRFDEAGRLWFLGRKSHRVRTFRGDMYTIPCETIFNQHPTVRRTALVGVPDPHHAGFQMPVVCVELEPGQRKTADLASELLALATEFEHTVGIRHLLFHPAFPVDIRHNAKIFREKLAQWAEARIT
ncbi:MAG: fatty acid CoA ligase family protein [Candidatus Sericytochromatia bacterium]|nr:fatty acid CoA ligase family protein [Candidatus Sericytochromatia bacterium]